jgi:hypothetical protein
MLQMEEEEEADEEQDENEEEDQGDEEDVENENIRLFKILMGGVWGVRG